MNAASLAIFATAYAMMVAMPGPGVAALMARVLSQGMKGIPALIAGYLVGDLSWFAAAALGLAAIAKTFAFGFLFIKYVGAIYLLYLAYKMWTKPSVIAEAEVASDVTDGQLFMTGLTVTLGNPKPMAFFLALLPTVIDLEALTVLAFVELSVVICALLVISLVVYALLADRARRFVSDARAMKVLNRICGTALAGAAVAVAR